jgi:geranylgeranyl pyrophosphate synthase
LNATLAQLQNRCNAQLPLLLGKTESDFSPLAKPLLERLFEASNYSLTNGGKRLRPLLVYATAASCTNPVEQPALDYAACAVEMIHAYSLVHDDLPAMDNDDLRRGKPTCHRAFDEATAVLVGDALQARAFELLAIAPGLSAEIRLQLVKELASASGARGMAGGQSIDVNAKDQRIDADHLEAMHALKTGALIRASVSLGAIIAGADAAQRARLDNFAGTIGLAFQVHDDVLDVVSDSGTLGKTQGADAAQNKPTYVTLLGLEGAREKAAALLNEALIALQDFPGNTELLHQIARFITARNH